MISPSIFGNFCKGSLPFVRYFSLRKQFSKLRNFKKSKSLFLHSFDLTPQNREKQDERTVDQEKNN